MCTNMSATFKGDYHSKARPQCQKKKRANAKPLAFICVRHAAGCIFFDFLLFSSIFDVQLMAKTLNNGINLFHASLLHQNKSIYASRFFNGPISNDEANCIQMQHIPLRRFECMRNNDCI